jgi:hypothetical protein
MLQEIIIDGKYKCNTCGRLYAQDEADISKGNHYFCSMKCVLEWDHKMQELAHREWNERWAPNQQKAIKNLKRRK